MRHPAAALLLVTVVLMPLAGAAAAPRSGYDDASAPVRSMQDDDAANPAFLWVQQGASLWTDAAVPAGRSCAGCHGAPGSMRGVAARYPAYDPALGHPLTMEQRINHCRTTHQGNPPLAPESEDLLALTAFVGLQSRGMPVAVDGSGPAQPFVRHGRTLFETRMGQLNLSCAQCHDGLAGQHLAGALIPQGHPNAYPLYRLEWQGMGSLYRRLRNCLTGVRAEPFPPDSPELTDIEMYLSTRAKGLAVETPGVRP